MILEAIINADYDKSVERFDLEVVDPGSIVFIGDSMFKNYPINDYFSNNNLVNRGIAGDTAEKVLKRLDQIIKIKPSVVIINAGTNDIVRTNQTVDQIVRSILKIKFQLEDNLPGVKVYILTLQPVLRDHEITIKEYMKHRNNDIIDSINEELEVFTSLVDTSSELKDSNNNLKLSYTTDGLHLTKEGYSVFSQVLAREIEALKLK